MAAPYEGVSTTPTTPGLRGRNASGAGVEGRSTTADAVNGQSRTGRGVAGSSTTWQGVYGHSVENAGVVGESDRMDGVFGVTSTNGRAGVSGHHQNGTAILGISTTGRGVEGLSETWQGVYGHSVENAGVVGESDRMDGVFGVTSTNGRGGVSGHHQNGTAILGISTTGRGVEGLSETWQGVYGHSVENAGVVGESDRFDGVFGVSHRRESAGVSGHNPGGMAGYFEGDVVVTGKVRVHDDVILEGADCAEEFAVDDTAIEAGSVLAIDDRGRLRRACEPYDRRVAGVVSGAGELRPGIVLGTVGDRHGETTSDPPPRAAIALVGRVMCRADASHGAIGVGDLLTTSATPGHAMRAVDRDRAFGAVLGKALAPLDQGTGLLPVLVALQ